MPLVSPKEILLDAFRRQRLIGAFNTGNLEMTRGIIRAAEEFGAPILLQVAEKRMPHAPLDMIAPLMVGAASAAKIPVAVQLDHGESFDILRACADYGFTGLMFDGSALPIAENILRTRAIRARFPDLWLEGEVGVLSGCEGGAEAEALHSDPQETARYAKNAQCDALAVSIGNAHGHYKGKPQLNFAVLAEIRALTNLPLVLHGGSGIPEEDLAKAVRLGICKVNIATASFDAFFRGAQTHAEDYFALVEQTAESVYQSTRKHLKLFEKVSKDVLGL
ncbi:MAG: class II fructose-bisphosphate aldolase [Oscillospiraceae bacterium]|jgi:fructose-bisphosphate aldolase class II|nr:class II fructose-bisphosphate aldolase [Oscillospiraceae bacterium]